MALYIAFERARISPFSIVSYVRRAWAGLDWSVHRHVRQGCMNILRELQRLDIDDETGFFLTWYVDKDLSGHSRFLIFCAAPFRNITGI